MKRFLVCHKALLAFAAVLLALCAWIFGWGGGPINLMDFPADQVDCLLLSCSHRPYEDALVTGKDDIQTVIHSMNALRHSGNEIKSFLRNGFNAGGSNLHTIDVRFTSGETRAFCLVPHPGGDMAYWVYNPDHTSRLSKLCSGSLDWFYAMMDRYGPCPLENNPFLS